MANCLVGFFVFRFTPFKECSNNLCWRSCGVLPGYSTWDAHHWLQWCFCRIPWGGLGVLRSSGIASGSSALQKGISSYSLLRTRRCFRKTNRCTSYEKFRDLKLFHSFVSSVFVQNSLGMAATQLKWLECDNDVACCFVSKIQCWTHFFHRKLCHARSEVCIYETSFRSMNSTWYTMYIWYLKLLCMLWFIIKKYNMLYIIYA